MTAPPWAAGSQPTADELNSIVPQTQTLASDVTITSTSAVPVLTLAGLVAVQYRITGSVGCEAQASAGTIDLSLHASGSFAVSAMRVNATQFATYPAGSTTDQLSYSTTLVNLGDVANGFTMTSGDLYVFAIDGTITVSTAGNMTVDLAEDTGGDGFKVRAGSYIRAERAFS